MQQRLQQLIEALGARFIGWALTCESCKRSFHRLLSRAPEMKYLLVNGPERFVVDTRDTVIGRELFLHGHFDFDKLEIALEVLKKSGMAPPDLLIDAGANLGSICIPAVKRGYFNRGHRHRTKSSEPYASPMQPSIEWARRQGYRS